MRFHRHDVRDMTLAFSLSFDLRRILFAGAGFCWTIGIALLLVVIFTWRAGGGILPDGDALERGTNALLNTEITPARLFFWVCTLLGWWIGFGWLTAPVLRSCALDISRDEHPDSAALAAENFRLGKLVALAPPLALLIPALLGGLVLLWSLVATIPGAFGGAVLALTMPLALGLALVAAVMIVLVAAALPLMGPAAVIEGHDVLEAISRSVSYVIQRPLRYAAYWLVKLGILAASGLFGLLVLGLAWALVLGAIWLVGSGEHVESGLKHAFIIQTAQGSTAGFASVFSAIFWGSVMVLVCWWMVVGLAADSLMYYLLRYNIDGATFDEILIPKEYLERHRHLNAMDTAAQAEEARQRADKEAEPQAAEQSAGSAK